jgi:hypothetical protein
MNEQQLKYKLRSDLVDIGRQAIEHALLFIPQDNPTRKLVQDRLLALHNGDKKMIGSIKPEIKYTQETCLLRASGELLKLSVSEKWLSGSTISSGIFTHCWDSLHFVSHEEMNREMNWQYKSLFPLIEQAFEQVRKSEKVSAA